MASYPVSGSATSGRAAGGGAPGPPRRLGSASSDTCATSTIVEVGTVGHVRPGAAYAAPGGTVTVIGDPHHHRCQAIGNPLRTSEPTTRSNEDTQRPPPRSSPPACSV